MIRVLVADDHAVVRQGLRQILSAAADVALVGEAANGLAVIDMVAEREVDVVLLDVAMPGKSGVDVLKTLHERHPKLPVLILSMYPEDQYAVRLIKAGAAGYLNKEAAPEQLLDAVRTAVQGKRYITPAVAELLAQEVDRDREGPPHKTLSNREFQIMLMLARGVPVSEIARELFLSVKTVSTHRMRILDKMGLKTNADLTYYAIKNRLVE